MRPELGTSILSEKFRSASEQSPTTGGSSFSFDGPSSSGADDGLGHSLRSRNHLPRRRAAVDVERRMTSTINVPGVAL